MTGQSTNADGSSAEPSPTPSLSDKAGKWIPVVVILLMIAGKTFQQARDNPPRESVSREELRLTAVRLNGSWVEDDELFGRDTLQWHGSAFIMGESDGILLLVTNSHCLALANLADADRQSDEVPDVVDYQLEVTFPSGKKRKVLKMAESVGSVDLAFLSLSAEGLKDGVDYVPISTVGKTMCQTGDTVVAIGTPLDTYFDGTQTHGRVSAVRDRSGSGDNIQVIQHSAPINSGNSGGPLFLESDGKYYPIAVNTWQVIGAQGIFMSISMREIRKADFIWSSADARGAVDLIQRALRRQCRLLRP